MYRRQKNLVYPVILSKGLLIDELLQIGGVN